METIESKYAIDNPGRLFKLSPQQLISCEHAVGLDGCNGGILYTAFEVLQEVSRIYCVGSLSHLYVNLPVCTHLEDIMYMYMTLSC